MPSFICSKILIPPSSFLKRSETRKQNSKNVQTASDSQGGQQQNMEIIQVISFVEETMQKLKIFCEKFKVQLDSNLTQ